ncbi:hypothetical protein Rsub_08178 [Raphidocelis subcapitata]|uniref:Uncharacterized protein n=1 Tax=Raphidocelis subcapitata TaxID=307507 RepID=A0A2V0PCV6_9CHLO|nr:hypothetical protein Rsub_08178 [Raphidocelis subcapitata]|eukprot:GBF94935.1 hypothetical protein Rsub_08178 [Raphidocelis subcapitata]
MGGQLLEVDPDTTQNWVKVNDFSGNLVDGADVAAVPPRFSPLKIGTQLQGYEACSAYGAKYPNGTLIVPVSASWVLIDAHLHVKYPATSGFQTARMQEANIGGIPVELLACSDDNPAPSCETPPTLVSAGDADDLTADECTGSTSYRVTLNAANTAAITPATGCTLETDGRTAGTGAVSFLCERLDRGTPYGLEFTAAPTDAECAPVTATVAVTPPALEAIAFTATPPTDEACDAQSGHLTFSVAASPAMSEAQYSGAALVVTSNGAEVDCTTTASDVGFEVDCTGLADGAYELSIAVPNTQYADCPHTGSVTGAVSIITPPAFAVTSAPAAQTICRDSTASFEFTVTGAGDGLVYTYSPEGGADCGQPNAAGTVTCTGVGATTTVSVAATYGAEQSEECATTAVDVPLTVDVRGNELRRLCSSGAPL